MSEEQQTTGFLPLIANLIRQPLMWLLVAAPLAFAADALHWGDVCVVLLAGIAIVPLAGLMGRATENLAETMGAGIGGLLNATFGNAAELIIALMALREGSRMYELVEASITGSIIGNILLVLGLALLCGGMRYPTLTFNPQAAGMGSTLLALAAIGLLTPSLYFYAAKAHPALQHGQAPMSSTAELQAEEVAVQTLSEEIAAVLAITYVLSLVFSLRTHKHLFARPEEHQPTTGGHHEPEWNRQLSTTILLLATVGVAVMSEKLVGSVEHAEESLGMNSIVIGVILVAIIGNAAEHSTAILMALKNKTDLAMNIAVGSSLQIAMFVAPVLVFASMLLNETPLDLHFSLMETAAVIISIAALALICHDGQSHWMEGVMLLAVYAILGLAFFHLPASHLSRGEEHSMLPTIPQPVTALPERLTA